MTTKQLISTLLVLAARNDELVDTLKEALDVDDEATVEISVSELELNSAKLTEAVSRLAPDALVPDKPNAQTQLND